MAWPGMKTGASPARDGSGVEDVSCPPKARWPLTMGCAPPLRAPRPGPPLLPRLLPPLFAFGAGAEAGSGAIEAGRRARAGFAGCAVTVAFPAAPPLRPLRWRGGRLRTAATPTPAVGGASTAFMTWNSSDEVID